MIAEKKGLHIPYLDGLRGVAILLVWVEHFFNDFYFCQIGWIGVNLFLLLSGYLITGRLFYHEAGTAGQYFRNFYMRRVLRIFPLYYGWLLFFFLLLPVFYTDYFHFYYRLYQDQIWYWLYMQNWNYVIRGYPANVLLVPLWSLAVEEQFYLIWPLCFRYAKLFNRKMIICIIILVSISLRIASLDVRAAYLSTLTACEPLLLGALIRIVEKEGRLIRYQKVFTVIGFLSLAGLAMVLYANNDLTNRNPLLIKFGYSCIDFIWAGLLYQCEAGGAFSERVKRALTAKWIRWLGVYSYGIYIFHWIILQVFVFRFQLKLTAFGLNQGLVFFISRAIGVLIVLFCSYLSYQWYEKRFLSLKRYFG